MNAAAAPVDLTQRRLERALHQRRRYRYVRPRVLREGANLRIESPCCSRNVDPVGGVIDIALLAPCAAAAHRWNLYARDHRSGAWRIARERAPLAEALDLLCADPERVFWP